MNKLFLVKIALIITIALTAFSLKGTSNRNPTCTITDCTQEAVIPVAIPIYQQITNFFTSLLSTDSWPARWNCGTWSGFHGWLYILSDIVIWLSYFAIPLILTMILHKKKAVLPFRKVIFLFVAFILACGLTHLIDALIFYWPAYRLSALLRLITAGVSVSTVFALTKVMPQVMLYKDPNELEKIVSDRTAELIKINSQLENEIIQRKNAESRVIELNELLSKFKDAVSKVSIISLTDKNGIIKEVNSNFERISGYSNSELIGKSHNIINSSHHSHDFWKTMWQTVSHNEVWRQEVKNKAKDGNFYWVDTSIIPIQDEETGKIKEYLSIRNDITQRKQAELKLMHLNDALEEQMIEKQRNILESEERFNTALEYSPVGMAIVDLTGRWMKVNKALCTLTGYSREELLQINFQKITHPDDLESDLENIKDLLKGSSTSYSMEKRYIHKNKYPIWIQLHGSLVRSTDNKPLYFIAQILDINDQKKHEELISKHTEELQTANKELESFSYSVSHDLRAPLRSINGYATILKEDYEENLDQEGKRIIEVIIKNSRIMGQLIDNLLEFSRLGRNAISKANVDMEAIVRSLANEMIPTLSSRKVNITIHPLEHVNVDPKMIRQVWINLISNAVKYTQPREQAEIEIGCNKTDSAIVFYVKDNGVGFNSDYKQKLFGVFQRLHRAEEFEGTGVGLALVSRIITRHGGHVGAESVEGTGATFYFSIPF